MSATRSIVRGRGGDWARQVVVAGAFGVTAVAAAIAAVRQPVLALGAAVAIAGTVAALFNLPLAVAALVASFYFDAYLTSGVGLVTPAKVVGAVAMAAWLIDWSLARRDLVLHRTLSLAMALALWVVLTTAVARDQKAALTTTLRYVIFISLFFLILQTVRGLRSRLRLVVSVAVYAATAAALIGLYGFFSGAVVRASGPIGDPNDYGFVLGATLPLALYLVRTGGSRVTRRMAVVCATVIFVAVLASFSRSALVGLACAALWAVATRRITLRLAAIGLAGMVLAAGMAYLIQPQRVQNTFTQKKAVADTNVSDRLLLWQGAYLEWRSSPLTGVGPGNYEMRFTEYFPNPEPAAGTLTTHNAYLNVMAELGLPGLVLLGAFLLTSWLALRHRFPDDEDADLLQSCLAGGFVVAFVGAMFLTEQFYPPFWFLSAVAISSVLNHEVRPAPAPVGAGDAPAAAFANGSETGSSGAER